MLTITYGQMRADGFARGMRKIANCPQLKSPKLCYNVAKIMERVQAEEKLGDDLHQKLVDTYAKKDADGKLEPFQGKPGTWYVEEEKSEEWLEKLKEFHAISFELDRPAMNLEELAAANLTPVEILALDPVLYFDDAPVPALPLA